MIDNKTGGVVALVSSPSFDINEFSYGINSKKWNLLKNNQFKPLLNKSISTSFLNFLVVHIPVL